MKRVPDFDGGDLSRIVQECGSMRKAAVRLEEEARKRPGDVALMHTAAAAHGESGRPKRALRLLRELVGKHPEMAPAHALMGRVLTGMGRHKAAVRSCKRALQIDSRLADARMAYGYALFNMGKPAGAMRMFRAAARIEPDNSRAYEGMGHVHMKIDRPMRAAAFFKKAAKISPDPADAVMELGRALAAAGLLEKAAAVFERAVDMRPDSPHPHLLLAVALTELGRYGKADASYRAGIARSTRSAIPWAMRADNYGRAGRAEQGRRCLEKATALGRRASARNAVAEGPILFTTETAGDVLDILVADAQKSIANAEGRGSGGGA